MARTYRATFKCVDLDNGALLEPSLHYQTDLSTGGSEPDPSDVAEGIFSKCGNEFLNVCSTRIRCDGLLVRSEEIPASGILPVEAFKVVAIPGVLAVAEGDVPRELVGIVNIHTATSSRSARGYITLPGPYSEGYITNKNFAGAYATAAHAFADKLDDTFTLGLVSVATVRPVVYSRTRRLRNFTPYTFNVTGATFNTRPHWRRSRGTSP
jgi:hypothetical protein